MDRSAAYIGTVMNALTDLRIALDLIFALCATERKRDEGGEFGDFRLLSEIGESPPWSSAQQINPTPQKGPGTHPFLIRSLITAVFLDILRQHDSLPVRLFR